MRTNDRSFGAEAGRIIQRFESQTLLANRGCDPDEVLPPNVFPMSMRRREDHENQTVGAEMQELPYAGIENSGDAS